MAAPTKSRYPQWQYDLLQTLGAKPTPTNLQFLNLWAAAEGVAATNNNPLAITDPGNQWQHSGVIAPNGGYPVYAFPSESIGVQATASFLQHGYQPVIDALKAGNNLGAMYAAVNGSGWCSGCQDGHYPNTVFQALNGKAPSVIFQGGSAGAGAQTNYQGKPVGCSDQGGVKIPLGPRLFTQCQNKAILGGLLVGGGSVLVILGLLRVAQPALVNQAIKGTPLDTASKALGKIGSSPAAPAASPASKPEAAQPANVIPMEVDGRRLDADERAAYRNRGPSGVRGMREVADRRSGSGSRPTATKPSPDRSPAKPAAKPKGNAGPSPARKKSKAS